MQAITTKYLPPTNTRGGRIVAKAAAGTVTVGFHDTAGDAHHYAAATLIRKLGWDTYGTWTYGGLPDGTGNCYVCTVTRDPSMYALDIAAELAL